MYESGKSHNVVAEMKRLGIYILGVSETHWPGNGQCKVEDHAIYYSINTEMELA